MRLVDLSSFYSERGGGVRTYHHRKLDFFGKHPEHSYAMIIAGARNEMEQVQGGGRIYKVRGFPVSKDGVYRQIWDLVEVRRILHLEKPDVIEIGSAYLDGWLGLIGKNGWNPAIVGFYHADFPDSYMGPAVKGLPKAVARPFVNFWKGYVKYAYHKFDATCVTSRYVERKLDGFGVTNTMLVPLGVDSERFHPSKRDESLRRELGVEPGEKLCLYVGRFGAEKGIDPLLEAAGRIAGMEGTHVVLVGGGGLEQRVRAELAQYPRAHVHGYVEDMDRLAAIYASADLFLSPGPYETFSLSTLEAMSSGLAVVAASSGGAGELVAAAQCGLHFTPQDGADLARRVEELIADGARLVENGKRARAFVEAHYSWDRTFTRMVEYYSELVHAKRSGTHLDSRRDSGVRDGDTPGARAAAGVGAPGAGAAHRSGLPRTLAS